MKILNKPEVTLIDYMGDDISVVNAARVSFAKESEYKTVDGNKYLTVNDVRLIKYLAKHKHYSPFNHTFISIRVKAPIFVARQLVKHEYMPWNEVSRRYVDEEPEFYIPDELHKRAENVKQGASEGLVSTIVGEDGTLQGAPETVILLHTKKALSTYNVLLNNRVAPEEARMVLPLNTMTEWIWSGTLKAYAKMLKLRLDSHTQGATREVAEQVKDIITPLYPISLPALLDSEVTD